MCSVQALPLFAPVRLACAYVPDFRLHVALQQMGGEPLGGMALVDPDDGRRLIVAASPGARTDGVVRGMTAIAAASIAPDLVVRAIDHAALAEAHRRLEDAVRSVTPTFESTGHGVLYASYAGLARRYGAQGEGGFVDDLRDVVLSLGLPVRVGVAGNRFAARAAAVMEGQLPEHGRGSILVPPGQDADFLRPLPVQLLPDAAAIVAKLRKLGVRTLGAFADLPRDGVARRFGARGTALHRLARGDDRDTLVPLPEPRRWAVTVHADAPVVTTELLERLLEAPLAGLIGRLDSEGLACGALVWDLVIEGQDPVQRRTHAAAPSGSLRLWKDLVHVELERLAFEGGVLSVTLEAQDITARTAEQERLTGPRAAPAGALARTLAHLAAELGPEAFGVLLPAPHPFPEQRQRLAVPGGLKARGRVDPPDPCVPDRPGTGELPLALRRLDPAEPIEVEQRRGRILGFRHKGGWQPVEGSVGPWDVATSWWERPQRRRYLQVRGRGAQALIYREPDLGRWFLSGWLD
jgi:protein ImuB